jgi:hypothetical protein
MGYNFSPGFWFEYFAYQSLYSSSRIWLYFRTRTVYYFWVDICNNLSWNLLGKSLTLMAIGYVFLLIHS